MVEGNCLLWGMRVVVPRKLQNSVMTATDRTAVTWTTPLICSQEGAIARGTNLSGMAQMFTGESVN